MYCDERIGALPKNCLGWATFGLCPSSTTFSLVRLGGQTNLFLSLRESASPSTTPRDRGSRARKAMPQPRGCLATSTCLGALPPRRFLLANPHPLKASLMAFGAARIGSAPPSPKGDASLFKVVSRS